jgi:hypothetical protein
MNTTADKPMTDRDARALATTRLRAETLFLDGYMATPTAAPGVYHVHQPEGVALKPGQKPHYRVDVTNQTCDCRAFGRLRACKHLDALNARVREALAFLAPLLPTAAPVPAAPAPASVRPRPTRFATDEPEAPRPRFADRAAFETARRADFD